MKFNLLDGTWDNVLLTPYEALELLKFLTEHVSCESRIRIGTGGKSGIGTNVVVYCVHHPDSQVDITDYESW